MLLSGLDGDFESSGFLNVKEQKTMKNKSNLIFVLIIIMAFGIQNASAQITITIPKIPKIKKDKPAEAKNETSSTTENTQTTGNKSVTPNDNCSGNIWLDSHIEEINKRIKEVDGFTPDRGWLTGSSNYDHLLHAVSPSAREKWLTGSNALDKKNCPNLVVAFDKLSVSAAKKLPLYLPNTKTYSFHNPAEEKLLKAKINNLSDNKIHYMGIQEASWLIDKNDFGIPTSRYKHGMAWVRYTPSDHPYCRIYYINIIQDYAGGGTYGASYAYLAKDELAGCPAERGR
jgi:hypothetical protein